MKVFIVLAAALAAANAQYTNQQIENGIITLIRGQAAGIRSNVIGQANLFEAEVHFAVGAFLRVATTIGTTYGSSSPLTEWLEFSQKNIQAMSTYKDQTADVATEAGIKNRTDQVFASNYQQIEFSFKMLPKIEKQTATCQFYAIQGLLSFIRSELYKLKAVTDQAATNFSNNAKVEQSRMRTAYGNMEKDANQCAFRISLDDRRACYLQVIKDYQPIAQISSSISGEVRGIFLTYEDTLRNSTLDAAKELAPGILKTMQKACPDLNTSP